DLDSRLAQPERIELAQERHLADAEFIHHAGDSRCGERRAARISTDSIFASRPSGQDRRMPRKSLRGRWDMATPPGPPHIDSLRAMLGAAMAESLTQTGFGKTVRRDRWWVSPLLTFSVLGSFVVYTTWAAFQGEHYAYGNYLSPFYSPVLFGDPHHAWFGPKPLWWPAW